MTELQSAVPLLHDYLRSSARRAPDKIALICDRQRYSYDALERASNALAHALLRRGVVRGDRVIVYVDNGAEAAIAFWAVLKANAVVSIVGTQTKPDKLAYLLSDCRPSALIVDQRSLGSIADVVRACPYLRTVVVSGRVGSLDAVPNAVAWADALRPEPEQEPPLRSAIDVDLAAIIYTSGSTGDPKGVMLTHRNMLTAATSISTYLGMREDDVVLGVLPLSFDYGLYQMIMCFRLGARLVLLRSFAYPAEVLKTVGAECVTGFPGVPTLYAMLAELKGTEDFDLRSVRFVTNTAAALEAKHIAAIRRLFPGARIFSMYGLTECKRVSYLPPEMLDEKPDSVGIAIPNTELWIVDENDRRVGPGVVGQLVVRGATVMRGYWDKPVETAKKLRPGPLPGELVLYTGDYAKLDAEGFLYFVGRMDDIIKTRGEKVAPREVERALSAIPGVKEAAVIGVPDEILGQAVKAFVALERGAEFRPADVTRECQKRLEGFMVPKYVQIVDSLPKSSNGKIIKVGLQ